jgi:hypothetical protein
MNNDAEGCFTVIVGVGILFAFVGMGYCLGDTFSKAEHKAIGRNEGIVFCNEKPKDCKYEYDYMKYLETQRTQK